jgi:peptidoglycan/LPS O-acetylase OafA/YrhL
LPPRGSMQKADNKIDSIIILRGIAALSVCIVHISLVINFHVNKIIDYIIMNGQQGVAIFFVISGFILPYSLYKKGYSIKGFFTFLFRRSIRIDPPYWASIALVFVVGLVPVSALSLYAIVLHVFYLVPFVKGAEWYSGIFWTLSIEFQFYILLGLFYPLLSKINAYYAVMSLLLVSAIFVFMRFTYRGIIISNFYDFVIGYIFFLGFIKKITKTHTLLIAVFFAIFLMAEVSYITGIVPLLAGLFIFLYKNKRLPDYILFTGKISYSLYLVHFPISYIFTRYTRQLIPNNYLLFVSCLTMCILFAWVFYKLIELPSMNLSRKLSA